MGIAPRAIIKLVNESMKKLKKVNESQFLQIVGLLALSKHYYKQILHIEEALADTLGIEYVATDCGHISDMIWNGEADAEKLLKKEVIDMP